MICLFQLRIFDSFLPEVKHHWSVQITLWATISSTINKTLTVYAFNTGATILLVEIEKDLMHKEKNFMQNESAQKATY